MSTAAEDGEVKLGQRVLDQSSLVLLGEHLARDLLGRHDRELGDIPEELVHHAAALGLDLATGLLQHLLTPSLGCRAGIALVRGRRLTGALDDLFGLLARLLR